MPRNTKSSKRSSKPAPVIPSELMTLDEVAHFCRLSAKSIQRRIAKGQFAPFRRIGRKMLWSRAQLLEWFTSGATPTGIAIEKRTRRRAA